MARIFGWEIGAGYLAKHRNTNIAAHPADLRRSLLSTRRGVHPSVTTFNCLLAAASDRGSYEALLEVGGGCAGMQVQRSEEGVGGRAGGLLHCVRVQALPTLCSISGSGHTA